VKTLGDGKLDTIPRLVTCLGWDCFSFRLNDSTLFVNRESHRPIVGVSDTRSRWPGRLGFRGFPPS